MSGSLTFLAWKRSGIYDLAPTGQGQVSRLDGSITLRLDERDGPGSVQHQIPFQIMGPGEVKSLAPHAVRRMVPPPYSSDAETTLSVHVDLAAVDLPWRFTPELPVDKHLRPWLVLVVGTAGESDLDEGEIEILPDNLVRLSASVVEEHPLDQAAQWAHVQIPLNGDFDLTNLSESAIEALIRDHGGRPTSRLLSPRQLTPNRLHIAAIVPTFQPDGSNSWHSALPTEVVVPVYHWWRFRSGAGGDFRTLAARLRARASEADHGRTQVSYDRIEPNVPLEMRGALGPVGGVDDPVDEAVKADLDQLLQPPSDPRGRPIIGVPLYGAQWREETFGDAWRQEPQEPDWGEPANLDPRHRGAAGLGADAAIVLQETIVETIKEQIGAVQEASQRINQLVAGLAAAGALWRQRLPQNSRHRLMLYGPSMRRIFSEAGSVSDQVTGGVRPMPPALFSTAARRVLRMGPARTALAQPTSYFPEEVIEEANTCPPLPEAHPGNEAHVDNLALALGLPPLVEVLKTIEHVDFDTVLSAMDEFFQSLPTDIQNNQQVKSFWQNLLACIQFAFDQGLRFDFIRLAQVLVTLFEPDPDLLFVERFNCEGYIFPPDDSLDELEEELDNEPPDRPCLPVDLDTLEEDLTTAIDPTIDPWIVDVVLDGIEGLPDPPLAPVEICTGVDLPSWRFLRDHHPNWLLPGVGLLQSDSVYAFESNPAFVDAFLLGLNTQTLGEMHWRNIPLAAGCTPLKMFWGRIDAANAERVNDIGDVVNWPVATDLGDPSHNPNDDLNTNLVLVVRSDLFLRYPATLVSAVPALEDGNGNPLFDPGNEPPDDAARIWPIFQGSIGEDITFIGFDISPQTARNYWLVLEEPASGYRFRNDQNLNVNNGADFAAGALDVPTRVLISGAELIPE